MARMPQVTARGLVQFLKSQGFAEQRQSGSHLTLFHAAAGYRSPFRSIRVWTLVADLPFESCTTPASRSMTTWRCGKDMPTQDCR